MRYTRSATPARDFFERGHDLRKTGKNRRQVGKQSKPRANRWQAVRESDFANPIGWRLLSVVRWNQMGTREFSEKAHGSKTKGGNLDVQLGRFMNGSKGLHIEQLLIYAKFGRVSLVWLLTGEGLPTQGLYGEPVGAEMNGFPPELQRAVMISVELDGALLGQALIVAGDMLRSYKERKALLPNTVRDWYLQLVAALATARHGSGIRPSTKPPRTG